MSKFGTSQSVRRTEDVRFLTGNGAYVDDVAPRDAAHVVFFRSPIAHATIAGLDVSAAKEMPGVRAIYTAADFAGQMRNEVAYSRVTNRDGEKSIPVTRPVLATDRVRYVGDAIAMVIADTLTEAQDAAEAIECDFDELPVHVATAIGGPLVHDHIPENVGYDWAFGDAAATDAAFAAAAHCTRMSLVDNRVISNPMETRGCSINWDGERLSVAFGGQGVWGLKGELATALSLDPEAIHVTTPDVGGGFGTKGFTYPEYFACAFAARQLGQTVRWMSTRGEAMLTDVSGRDHETIAEAAFDENYKLQAVRISCISNLGAYNSNYAQMIASELALKVMPGVYDFQTAFFEVKGIYTNTTPVDAYRGAGRPEAIYVIERLMDWSARDLGLDPLDLRRRNFIPAAAFPYKTVAGETYDVGDFDRVLTRAEAEADLAGFAARRTASEAQGKLRGLGLAYYIESILGAPVEDTRIEFADDGLVNIYVGTQSTGQGHETVYKQFLNGRAGIPFDRIRVVQGDSQLIAKGGGTGGSRSVTMQGGSINKAADEVIAKFEPLAAEELEVAGADLIWENGAFHIAGTDRSVDLMALAEVARRKNMQELLTTQSTYKLPARSYPNGAHFAEVEVDPETGDTRVVKYTVVDDFGYLVNPMLAEGQVHGGVVQGIGQAITEHVVYSEDGQLLSGSFMDYAMPRADDAPSIDFHAELVPSTANEIGMKGCGEAGTVGALAAVTNAALDAVWARGVRHVDMPLTPLRMWGWLNAAKA